MLIAILGVTVVLLLTYIYFTFYLKPQKSCKRYSELLKSMGYRVYELPFRPFSATLYELYNEYSQTKGDPCYLNKEVFKNYDVVISNLLNYPSLIFTNMKMGKEILTPDKLMTAPKVQLSMKLLNHTIGSGLAFLEGDSWKERRKILSKAFSFELLKNMVPLISKLCDQTYTKLEEAANKEGEVAA